jgi:hypothetical protein
MKLNTLVLLLISFLLVLSGCGNGRRLQSITVSPSSMTVARSAQATFTASGQFNMSPMSMNPLSVSWKEFGPGVDQVNFDDYTLTSQPFTVTCFVPGTFTVVAYAPTDPGAPASGSVPDQVYVDLVVQHTMSAEGSFVAATGQITCQ